MVTVQCLNPVVKSNTFLLYKLKTWGLGLYCLKNVISLYNMKVDKLVNVLPL